MAQYTSVPGSIHILMLHKSQYSKVVLHRRYVRITVILGPLEYCFGIGNRVKFK
jgi:hypothetical protein